MAVTVSVTACGPRSDAPGRIIELQTEEVTSPDITVSPDGTTLVFSLLGHLFSLPVEGGVAQQLTFGPFYHHDPTFSNDGTQLALLSNRDGSEDNVFVLDMETGDLAQVTHEPRASDPSWSPDDRRLLYLGYPGASRSSEVARVREIELENGSARTLDASGRRLQSVFYGSGGSPGWGVVRESAEGEAETLIEWADSEVSAADRRVIPGEAVRILPSADGDGYFARTLNRGTRIVRLRRDSETTISEVASVWSWYASPRFAVTRDELDVFFGEQGRLWRASAEGGPAQEVHFQATARLELADPVPLPSISLSTLPERLTVSSPRVSPDGGSLVFGALGSLWQQSFDRGEVVERLVGGDALARDPAFSPDGRALAYVLVPGGESQKLRVRDLESGVERTIHEGAVLRDPAWHPDGERMVVAAHDGNGFSVVFLDPGDPGRDPVKFETGRGFLSPRPHFSSDGRWLYYRVETADTALIQRVGLEGNGPPQIMARIPDHLGSARLSPDGQSVAFRRDGEIWIAPLQRSVSTDSEGARRISPTGGNGFAFASDGRAVIYATGGRTWVQPLDEGVRREIPIGLDVDQELPGPLLLRRARVLDFSTGAFRPEASLLVDAGRIRWIGQEEGREIPTGTQVLDAEGRYVIPGLVEVHNHIEADPAGQAAWIAHGITTVRDMGGEVGLLAALSERSLLTSSPVPRYVYSGDFLRGHRMNRPRGMMLVRGGDQVRSGIRGNKDGGASFIKVYFSVPWPLQRIAADEARRWGLPIAAHGQHVQEVVREVTLGYRFLEHIDPGGRFFNDVLQLLSVSGTYWTPTLSLGGTGQLLGGDLLRAMAAGVKLLIGSDAPLPPGTQLHREMTTFVQAGFTPLEVLQRCTRGAAEALGVDRDLGSLEAGKLADMVILGLDPLVSIDNTRDIWRVIKGGWLFDPQRVMEGSEK